MRPIDADALMEKLNGIWDCNDMTFAPVDGCCIDADCKSCRWRETIEYVKRLVQNQTTVSPWHRVEERLPEPHEYVLCCGKKGGCFVGWTLDNADVVKANGHGRAFVHGGNARTFTHWMPLPEPPIGTERSET